MTMNRKELVTEIASRSQLTQKDVDKVLTNFFDIVGDTLTKGDKIQIAGFGTFEVREKKARTGKNPRTGEPMEIAASKAPAFKAGKLLKDMVNS